MTTSNTRSRARKYERGITFLQVAVDAADPHDVGGTEKASYT